MERRIPDDERYLVANHVLAEGMRQRRFCRLGPFFRKAEMGDEDLPVLIKNGNQCPRRFQPGFDNLDNILEFGLALNIKQTRIANGFNAFRW